jgi:ribonuclease HI
VAYVYHFILNNKNHNMPSLIDQKSLKDMLASQSFWIYSDGSALSSGVRSGAYAAMILGDHGLPVMVVGACNETTINRMELAAINAALLRVRELSRDAVHGLSVTITTDSQVTQHLISGEKKRGSNLDLWAQFDVLSSGFEKIDVVHISRNTEPPQAQADVLCDAARRAIHKVVEKALAHEKFVTFELTKKMFRDEVQQLEVEEVAEAVDPFAPSEVVRAAMQDSRIIEFLNGVNERTQDALDETVHEVVSRDASSINNSGSSWQVEYLLSRGWSVDQILDLVHT